MIEGEPSETAMSDQITISKSEYDSMIQRAHASLPPLSMLSLQYSIERCEDGDSSEGQESHTTLSYVVDVEPKLWLPVRLVEGRLCREITLNLSCIRVEAQKRGE